MGFFVAALSLGFVLILAAGDAQACLKQCLDAQDFVNMFHPTAAPTPAPTVPEAPTNHSSNQSANRSLSSTNRSSNHSTNQTAQLTDAKKREMYALVCPFVKLDPNSCILSDAKCIKVFKTAADMEAEKIKKHCERETAPVTVIFIIKNLDYEKVKEDLAMSRSIKNKIISTVLSKMENLIGAKEIMVSLKKGSVQATVAITKPGKSSEISQKLAENSDELKTEILAAVKDIPNIKNMLEGQSELKDLTVTVPPQQVASKAGKAMVSFMIVFLAQLLM